MIEFALDAITVTQFVVSALLPLLVGLVTTKVTHSGTKAALLATLTLIGSLGAEAVRAWQDGQVYDLSNGLFLALPAFVLAIGMHYGLYVPTGAAETVKTSGVKAKPTEPVPDDFSTPYGA